MDVKYAVGKNGMVGARLGPGVDLMQGLKYVCTEAGIRSGAIVACSGSLAAATLMYCVPIDPSSQPPSDNISALQSKFGFRFTPPIRIPGPLELVGLEGVIMHVEGQEQDVMLHLHGVIIDSYGKAHGGHFIEGGTPTLVTLDVVLCATEGVKMIRRPSPDTFGIPMLTPEPE